MASASGPWLIGMLAIQLLPPTLAFPQKLPASALVFTTASDRILAIRQF
jgi:hypothetical protein